MKPNPLDILETSLASAQNHQFYVKDSQILDQVKYVATCISNRAGVRLLMACMLAKIDRPRLTHETHIPR